MSKAGCELADGGQPVGPFDVLEAVVQLPVHLSKLVRGRF
jgi:hypothetical protein